MRLASLLALTTLLACTPASKTDKDMDGIMADVDCNDYDQTIGAAQTYYLDADKDGFGGDTTETTCKPAENFVTKTGDCNDEDDDVNPAMTEVCNEIDDDCDSWTDEGLETTTFYADADDDGFGDSNNSIESCDARDGYVENNQDCDDTSDAVFPGAVEVCDGKDNDCDAIADEGDAVDAPPWYIDRDGDTYGNDETEFLACEKPGAGWVERGMDCNDLRNDINPDQDEICDNIDNNCDSLVDGPDSVDATTYYMDSDSDTFGDADVSTKSCKSTDGYVLNSDDCDDADSSLNPNTYWYEDGDTDSYGTPDSWQQSCTQPTGFVRNTQDCNDADDTVNPDAAEVCDTIDNNCDGLVDDSSASDAKTWYADLDGDGYGNAARSGISCSAPPGFVADSADCDDTDEDAFPGQTWYQDADGDNYGNSSVTLTQCLRPAGYGANPADCDDTDDLINPGAQEYCDGGIDNDCDGLVDAADPSNAGDATWYYDGDADNYGLTSNTLTQCTQPTDYVLRSGDCDDTVDVVNPGLAEVCNDGYDNDCDGTLNSCGLVGTYKADDAEYTFYGTVNYAYLGGSVTGVGDMDDDGADDFMVSSYYSAKKVYLIGSDQTLATTQTVTSADTASFGTTAGYYFARGNAIGGVGDFNGDGDRDVIIGHDYSSTSSYRGEAYLFLGPFSGDYDTSDADHTWQGGATYDYEAKVVRAAGDVDDDGYDDVLIGSPSADGGSTTYSHGKAYLIYGSSSYSASNTKLTDADLIITGSNRYGYFGGGLAGEGDLDGDNVIDIMVAAYGEASYAGKAYVFPDGLSGSITPSDATLSMQGKSSDYCGRGENFSGSGHSLDTSGDIDDDGYNDIVIGCFYADSGGKSNNGATYIILGGSKLLDSSDSAFKSSYSLAVDADITLTGQKNYEYSGSAAVYAGDTNGDDVVDLLIGAYYKDKTSTKTGVGATYVINGPLATGTIALGVDEESSAIIWGTNTNASENYSYFGGAVSPIGDFNDDGLDDFAVGAYSYDKSSTYSSEGALYVFLGEGL